MTYNREECDRYRESLKGVAEYRKEAEARGEGVFVRMSGPPPGYKQFLEDEEYLERKARGLPPIEPKPQAVSPVSGFFDEYRNKLVFFVIVTAAVVSLYYVVSPYQNCVRDLLSDEFSEVNARLVCGQRNTW